MKFSTTLLGTGGNTAGIEVPSDVLAALGGGKRPAVQVTINGFSYRTTLGSMNGRTLIPVSAERRALSGTSAGDAIEVELALDTTPREVEVPVDLATALAQAPGATERFGKLSASNRSRLAGSVSQAKAPETRQRRIEKVLAELQAREA